jgi:hypothetical protein
VRASPGASNASSRGYAAPAADATRSLVATPNYSYEKRQRELAKKRKQEEKRQKKAPGSDRPEPAPAPAPSSFPPVAPPADDTKAG